MADPSETDPEWMAEFRRTVAALRREFDLKTEAIIERIRRRKLKELQDVIATGSAPAVDAAVDGLLRSYGYQGRERVDVGIITMKEEEFDAVLELLPPKRLADSRRYNRYEVRTRQDRPITVGVVKCAEQGNGESQSTAADMLKDLAPRWILVVGIAGSRPAEEVSLGDVVISTAISDLTVEARNSEGRLEFGVSGGPLAREAQALAASVRALERDGLLEGWNKGLGVRPLLDWGKDRFYGDEAWQQRVEASLRQHEQRGRDRRPKACDGRIISSDRLLKDPELLQVWLKFSRNALAIEMESAGVYRAARERALFLAIRGISDIVGYKRSAAWTSYACRAAAGFALALVRSGELGRG